MAGLHSLFIENVYFEVRRVPGRHPFVNLFLMRISEDLWTRCYAIFYDCGGHLGSLGAALGTGFKVNRAPGRRMDPKVVPGSPESSLWDLWGCCLKGSGVYFEYLFLKYSGTFPRYPSLIF